MKLFVRFTAVLIVAILLFSSIFFVFFPEVFEKDEKTTDELNGDNEIDNNGADDENE